MFRLSAEQGEASAQYSLGVMYDNGQGFQKAWKRALKKSSIGWNVREIDFRHFFASFMLNYGVDHLTVATLMGHSSVEMLKKRNGHFDDDTLRKAVKVFDKIEGQSSNCLQNVCKTK